VPYKISTEAKGLIEPSQVKVTSFASYSSALMARSQRVIDYTTEDLSANLNQLVVLAVKLANVAAKVEEACDGRA